MNIECERKIGPSVAMQSVNGTHKFLDETALLRRHLNAAASGETYSLSLQTPIYYEIIETETIMGEKVIAFFPHHFDIDFNICYSFANGKCRADRIASTANVLTCIQRQQKCAEHGKYVECNRLMQSWTFWHWVCVRVWVFSPVDSNRKSHIRSFAPSTRTHIVNYKLITQSLQLLELTRYVACVDRQTFWILQFKLR